MSSWICCNSCFRPPAADLRLAITSCGHIICSTCFRKGEQRECLICKAQCQVTPLSDKSSSEVKALFSDVSSIAKKYFSEISKVLQFQMRQRQRLLAHYQKRNAKIEECLYKMKQEMQEMNKKIMEQKAYIAKLENALQHQSAGVGTQQNLTTQLNLHTLKPGPMTQQCFTLPVSLSRQPSSQSLVQPMDVDAQTLFRKPDTVGSTSRISLQHPPRDGQLGAHPYGPSSHSSSVSGSCSAKSAAVRDASLCSIPTPLTARSLTPPCRRDWTKDIPVFKPPAPFSSMSFLEPHRAGVAKLLPK